MGRVTIWHNVPSPKDGQMTLLLLSALAWADIPPPRLLEPECDLKQCAGLETRMCSGQCAPESDGWVKRCSVSRKALYCRTSTAAVPAPEPALVRALIGEPADFLRLPSTSFGTPAYDPIGAWGDDQVIERIAWGRVLRPIDPEAFAPVLQAPLAIRDREGGAALGTLRVGTAVSVGEGGALSIHLDGLTVRAWAQEAPALGRTFPAQPEADGGEPFCFASGGTLHAMPEGPVVAQNTSAQCVYGWGLGAGAGVDWMQVHHAESGIDAWISMEALEGGGYRTLLGGIGGIVGGGGGSAVRKTLSTPRFAYAAPDGGMVGYLEGGTYLVEEVRADGWWRTSVAADSGAVSVWFPPDPASEGL